MFTSLDKLVQSIVKIVQGKTQEALGTAGDPPLAESWLHPAEPTISSTTLTITRNDTFTHTEGTKSRLIGQWIDTAFNVRAFNVRQ